MKKFYTVEELNSMKRDEVRKVAKEFKIPKWGKMNKDQMIEAIANAQTKLEENEGDKSMQDNVHEVEQPNSVDVMEKEEKKIADVEGEKAPKSKLDYLKDIKRGTLVAFKVNVRGHEKVKSAAVDNVSQSRRVLKLKTKYGAEFIVPFEDVIWVRTNSRWPKGVYELLKGVNRNDKQD